MSSICFTAPPATFRISHDTLCTHLKLSNNSLYTSRIHPGTVICVVCRLSNPMFLARLFDAMLILSWALVAWRSQGVASRFLGWWLVVSVVLGFAGDVIPWRTASGFHHGVGTPVPHIIWERSKSDPSTYDDFPMPAGLVLNPILVMLVGCIAWWGLVGILRLRRRWRVRIARR